MTFKPFKIGKYIIENPIIQGGMGVGISWDQLAGTVSKEGGLGVISAVGTGIYKNRSYLDDKEMVGKEYRPLNPINFYAFKALKKIFENARKICNDKPLAANILYVQSEYDRVVKDACEAGANIIITGAGLPLTMPDAAKDYPDVALVPIVSTAKALRILCRRWKKTHNKLPDAVIVEGPLSGGHQGFKYEECFLPENQLEVILPPVVEEAKNWGNMPIIAAGGIWDHNDIIRMMELGASGVQLGTRFIGTVECDASDTMKQIIINAKEEDIKLFKSPVGYPARGVKTELHHRIEKGTAPKVACISNCVSPCNRGEEAKIVGYCIADRLSDAYDGIAETGLFFTGANGYRLKEIITVKALMEKLMNGEEQ
ncbi:MAG: nitronate monooxygenase [Sulfurovum sp.]|nr:nitronate monooxygenase [Sulfurovum sp.]MCB4745128.1 nitronate monooxygenase [Sulfurovum sp.]MCB4746844.1 nitronate monooxygenase [Sulfurovum sp.]MCB4748527.1 nitronate monooxygenase [Sulfurovum sp.]MCB4750173.1 nitronate monooxygenase [Sulfurovum sp.]